MASLGVQILTMDSVTSRIFRNTTLTKTVSDTVALFVKKLIKTKADKSAFYQCRFLRYDLKYLAKPAIMDQIVSETSLVQDLLEASFKFHFSDVQSNVYQMEEFGDRDTQKLLLYTSIDLEISSVLEAKYLSFV